MSRPDWRPTARVLVDGLDHPEGVCWDPEAERLYAGGEAGQIYAGALDGDFAQVATVPGLVLGVAVDGAGRVLACASSDGSLCVVEDGASRRLLTEVDGRPLVLPNYAAFSPDGTLWLSDSGTWKADDGRLVALLPDGSAHTVTDRLPRFTNGLAVSADGRTLYVVESLGPGVSAVDLTAPGAPPVDVVRLPGTVPDGLAVLADGSLLISCYRPDQILHLAVDGTLTVVARDPEGTLLAAPTNICLAGPALDVLVAANLNRWHLTRLDAGFVGAPPHRPRRWAVDALPAAPG
jgi:gluconolactonase